MYKFLDGMGLNYHGYADDHQIYFHCKSLDGCENRITNILVDVQSWLSSHFLKLNPEKTELLIFGKCYDKDFKVQLDQSDCLKVSESAKNLGVFLDKDLAFEKQISSICKSCYYQLYKISKNRKYMNLQTAKRVVSALVLSKLSFCLTLYGNMPSSTVIKKLQNVQNLAARIVTKTPKYAHITPVLKQLNWLPIKNLIEYRLLLVVYKALDKNSPEYLNDLLKIYNPPRSLRSENQKLLTPVLSKTNKAARAFCAIGPDLWNKLPRHVRLSSNVNIFKFNLLNFIKTTI